MKKYCFLILCLTVAYIQLFAQTQPDIEYAGGKISKNVAKFFKPNKDSVDQVCREGVVFVKFKVLNGAFTFDKCSAGTPVFLNDALKIAIDSLNTDKILCNKLSAVTKIFILPVMYDYDFGCKYPKPNDTTRAENFYKAHNRIQTEKNFLKPDVFNSLFYDREYKALECILLHTYYTGKTGY